jgi:hypothetical protein
MTKTEGVAVDDETLFGRGSRRMKPLPGDKGTCCVVVPEPK